MNDAQAAPGASLIPDSIGVITGIHFVLIALFAVAAIAIILIGMRRKGRRKRAEQVVEERIEQAEETAAPPPPAPRPEPAPTAAPPPVADEPIAAVTAGEASPAVEAASAPAGDDPAQGPVTQLKGLGPKVATRLGELGVATVGDLAALSDADAARIDADLGPFAGRMARDRWIEQARLLAAGDRAGFEAVFGKL